jgi:hypothetical protein
LSDPVVPWWRRPIGSWGRVVQLLLVAGGFLSWVANPYIGLVVFLAGVATWAYALRRTR